MDVEDGVNADYKKEESDDGDGLGEEASDGGRLRQNPEEGYAQGEAAATNGAAILRLVRDEQTRRPKRTLQVERNSLSDQIALLEEMLHKGTGLTSGGENQTQSRTQTCERGGEGYQGPFR
ncbi:hypothetical protein Bca4012_017752 [Brassica carinata]